MRASVLAAAAGAFLAGDPGGGTPAPGSSAAEKVKLVLDAPRVQTILPGLAAKGYGKAVEVVARLEGDPSTPQDYYCLDETWDWGDGTESVRENDCEPYEDGSELQRIFTDAHHYRPGQYTITLRLTRSERTVIKGVIDVRIY